jgi:hypothetical protein
VCNGQRTALDRGAHQVCSGVLLGSPCKCVVNRTRAAPAKIGDWLRHQTIGAKWQHRRSSKEFGAACWRRRWVATEQLCHDPLKQSASARERATENHPVAKWCGCWTRPEATWECGSYALRFGSGCGDGDATRGTAHINTETGPNEAGTDDGGEPIIHSCGDGYSNRKAEFGGWAWKERAYSGAREHLWWQRALIQACGEEGVALRGRNAPRRIPEGADRLARESQGQRIPGGEQPGRCCGYLWSLTQEPSGLR